MMGKTPRRILHGLISVLIIGAGIGGFIVLTAQKPQLQRSEPPPPVPMVQVAEVAVSSVSIPVVGEGTVQPLREIQLISQVSGKIVEVSPKLINGGSFQKGDLLLQIDPVDYELAVTLAQARVKDSQSELRLTEEEAAAAQEEWQLLYADDSNVPTQPPPLVAKIPQLAAARAKLAADEAELQKALLNQGRTILRAPFNGRVSSEEVDSGQYVAAGKPLATLFSTEAAEIVVPFEDENLFWFSVPEFTPDDGPGSVVEVMARLAGRDRVWPGRVARAEGKMDPRTRMVNVVVRVDRPYATKPPLAAGLFVTVKIQGRKLPDAVVIPRTALHDGNIVWVVDPNGILHFRRVEVARLSPEEAILTGGLTHGERVVTSLVKAVTDGMRVRVQTAGEDQST
jgi:RND family efflux transporter MFP subunit